MDFAIFSLEEMRQTNKFTSIMVPHLLISIRSRGQKVDLPNSHYTQETLVLEFDDVQDIMSQDDYFDADLARQILEFVDKNCHRANLIISHCQAGLSRSAAVCSALSKIINNRDDMYFSNRIPNMLVYLSILEEFFLTPDYDKVYKSLWYLRERSLSCLLSPQVLRLNKSRIPHKKEKETVPASYIIGGLDG